MEAYDQDYIDGKDDLLDRFQDRVAVTAAHSQTYTLSGQRRSTTKSVFTIKTQLQCANGYTGEFCSDGNDLRFFLFIV